MKNLFKINSDKATSIMMKIKLSLLAASISSYGASHEKVGFWLLLGSGVADILVSVFSKKTV